MFFAYIIKGPKIGQLFYICLSSCYNLYMYEKELQNLGLLAGWGGSPTIGGSPQGVSSRLTIDEVVAVVEKYLR